MEEDEIEAAATHSHKLPRVEPPYPPPDGCGGNLLHNHHWHHHSSRIVRVSRATGGKDRHSKVMTSKGLRDRRVRLSVATAIQFYDLQDRLGYDQPSKAVEWLIKAAGDAISELPSLNSVFPENGETINYHQIQHIQNQNQKKTKKKKKEEVSVSASASKSACSSTSETSKGSSGLSLSRSEIRVKARERARERAAREKEKEIPKEASMSHTASFTELLTGGIGSTVTTSPNGSGQEMNGGDESNPNHNHNNLLNFSAFNDQNFSFNSMSDQLMMPPVVTCSGSGSDYNMLNFSICCSNSGYSNRGTLQSNSSSSSASPHHLQRFQVQTFDGSSSNNLLPNFFIGPATTPNPTTIDNHLHFSPLFDARLQLSHSHHKPKPGN